MTMIQGTMIMTVDVRFRVKHVNETEFKMSNRTI